MTPEHIVEKINQPYKDTNHGAIKILAAEYGYSLAQEEISRINSLYELVESQRKEWSNLAIKKQNEIDRLKELIKEAVTHGMMEAGCGTTLTYDQAIAEFKQIHNI